MTNQRRRKQKKNQNPRLPGWFVASISTAAAVSIGGSVLPAPYNQISVAVGGWIGTIAGYVYAQNKREP